MVKKSGSQEELQIRYEGWTVGCLIVSKRRFREIQDSNGMHCFLTESPVRSLIKTVNVDEILGPDAIGKEKDRKSATLKRVSLLAEEFRAKMSAVTTLPGAEESKYGEYREAFYDEVIMEAEKVRVSIFTPAQLLANAHFFLVYQQCSRK